MHFLHAAALRRGAKRIRLKVHRENVRGIDLYKSLGYEFGQQEGSQLIGYLQLAA